VTAVLGRTFRSLQVPNYRRYFAGQIVSISGNWMQNVAAMWLVVELTRSGVSVGITAALQFLPILLLGAWGGALADRLPKRRLLMWTNAAMAVPTAALAAVTIAGAVEVWMVYAVVLLNGTINAIDNPARQAFVVEMVGADRVVNAVALNSVIVHASRIAGPAAAGVVIALAGVGPCFALNALSFLAMVGFLRAMDPGRLEPAPRRPPEPGQVRAALAYVRRTPALLVPIAMMAVIGTVSFNFQVVLPLMAERTWAGGASTYAALTAVMGAGSVAGALLAGARGRVTPALLVGAAAGFGVAELVAAAAPTLAVQMAVLPLLGAASVTFAAGVNASLQLAVAPEMRGRVMALYSVVFLGSTPIGAPAVGWLAEQLGPRAGLVAGGVAALAAALAARAALRRLAPAGPPPAALAPREDDARPGDRRPAHGERPAHVAGEPAALSGRPGARDQRCPSAPARPRARRMRSSRSASAASASSGR
jgi:MFS family permease